MMAGGRQQGMAMLMALVLLAIASALAVSIWHGNQLSIARMTNLQQSYQAKHYAQGLMLWASDILREDYANDEFQHDSNADAWLQGVQGMVVEDAVLSGQLVGLNNRFNINNVYVNGVKDEVQIAYFRRLLLKLNLDVQLTDKVVDWIDADQIPEPNGAEDFAYLARSPSYQTASRQFKHIDELLLLDGMTAADFALLSPYVTAFPLINQQATKMNVNTMPPVMLSALDLLITEKKAIQLYNDGRADYKQLSDFFEDEIIRYILTENAVALRPLIDVKTSQLEAQSLVQMGDNQYVMYALLQRFPVGDVRVLHRSMRTFLPAKQVQ